MLSSNGLLKLCDLGGHIYSSGASNFPSFFLFCLFCLLGLESRPNNLSDGQQQASGLATFL
jgi:hypothetical protein